MELTSFISSVNTLNPRINNDNNIDYLRENNRGAIANFADILGYNALYWVSL